MAITDNIIARIRAEAGQTAIVEAVSTATLSGAGTQTLVDDATYGFLWRLTGGAAETSLSGPSKWTGASVAEITTLAFRFRVSSRASNYTKFLILGDTGGASCNGLGVANSGTSTGTLRVTPFILGNPQSPVLPTYTTNTVKTIVFRFSQAIGAADATAVWVETAGRSGSVPDFTSAPALADANRAISYLGFLTATETLDILDFVAWNRGLSDAEAAAVADDIRGQVYPSAGGTDATAPGATITGTATLTPGAATGASAGSAPGATLTGTATLTAGSATGGAAPTTGSFTIPEALENNTGSLWLNEPVAWTWTPTGRVGSMVGKTPIDGSGTTHATTGLLTITGLPLGAGQCDIAVLGATPADDAVYRTYGTVV